MKNKEEEVYWLSFTDLGENTQITPAERNGILGLTREKKIQLFTSIRDGLGVLSIGRGGMSGKVVSVYKPVIPSPDLLLKPANLPYENLLAGKEYWCLVPLSASKVCDIKVGKEIDARSFKYGGRVLKFSAIIPMKFKIYAWDEILPEWDKKGKTMKLKRKNFGSTADKATEDKPVAREAGLIGGSALIGLGAGLSALSTAERLDKAAEIKGQTKKSWAEWEHERRRETAKKYIDKHAPAEKKKEVLEKTMKKLKKIEKKELEDIEKSTKRFRKITKPVSKFAKTKGGKAALIGVPTAIIGGVVYKSAKKKKKSDKKEGEAK